VTYSLKALLPTTTTVPGHI